MTVPTTDELNISRPLTLPCGLEIPNRIVKAALAEQWADKKNLPSRDLIRTYNAWAQGGWGMVLTGNVQVDLTHLGQNADVAVTDRIAQEELLSSWREWTKTSNETGTPMIMQLNHPGRQSPLGAGSRGYLSKSIAPSAIPLHLGDGLISNCIGALVFGTPREMTAADITHVVERFAEGARLASEAGFAGVQIHAAHGYLLAQFLSAKSNKRTDEYGGTPKKRSKIVVDILVAIRKVVPAKFCVGIKLNSVDHQSQQELDECIEQLDDITAAGVDFVEVSGGTYENPVMMLGEQEKAVPQKSERTQRREAFFLDFAHAIRDRFRHVPLMVTGGFRSRQGMEEALRNGDCDIIGVGRPSILDVSLPKTILLNKTVGDEDARIETKSVSVPWIVKKLGGRPVAGGAETAWYTLQMHKIIKL